MREIKFIWVCRNIKFNEIERVELTDTMLLSRSFPSWIITDNCELLAKIIPSEVKDKSGREIYEGDVIKGAFAKTATWQIVFTDAMFTMQMIQNPDYRQPLKYTELDWEVIGNIYENPELLDKQ